MVRDIDYFESRLVKLDGFEDAAEYLRNIAKSKEVKSADPPPAPEPAPADEPEEGEEEKSSVGDEQPAAPPKESSNGATGEEVAV